MLKRTTIAWLGFAVVLSMALGACSSNNNNSGNNAATTAATKAATVAASVPAASPATAAAAKPASPAAATARPASPASSPAAGAAGGKALKVGLVTDVGKIDDKSFNQSAWEGVQQAKKDLGADIKSVSYTHLTLPTIYSV